MPIFNYEDVFLLETLGEGGFGKVQKGYHKREQNYVALKTFKELNQESIEQIILEDNILQKVESISSQSPSTMCSFLKYYGAFKDPRGINQDAILLEMESGICTLDDVLSAGKKFEFCEFLPIIRGLIKGFALLQKKGIANRDIKPQNIILVEDYILEGQFFYKVSDFGIGCQLPENCDLISCSEISGLSKHFAAPEVIDMASDPDCEEDYNPYIADVYSLGILALKMIDFSFGKKKLKSGLLSKKENFPADYETFFCVLEEMLKEDHKKRMDFIRLDVFLEEKIQSEVFANNKFDFKKQKDNEKTEYFYEIWLEKRESKAAGTIEGLQGLYDEHNKLYQAYDTNVTRLKKAFEHLNKVWKFLQQLKNRRLEGGINQSQNAKMEIEKENRKEIYCLNRFGNIYEKMGDLKKSEEYLVEALKKCEMNDQNTNLNKEDFATTFTSLGCLHENLGNLPKAEEFFLKSLKIREDLFGEKHHETAMSYGHLGALYENIGNLLKAEEFYLKSLKIYLDLFGEKHSYTATSYNNLGLFYKNIGNLQKTEEFYLKSLEIYLDLFGEKHSNTATSYNNLGLLYDNTGKLKKAEEFKMKALKIRLELFGENHSDTADSYNNLGDLYENMGDFPKAEEFYFKALNIRLNLYGEKHSNISISYTNLGVFFQNIGNFSKAKEFFLKSSKIYMDLYGENHSDTASSYNSLGNLYDKLGDFAKSEEFYLKSLKIYLDLFGEKHAKTATLYNDLGLLYDNMGIFPKAEEFYLKSLKIHRDLFGEKHFNTGTTYINLGSLYENLGDSTKALEYYSKAYEIALNLYGENHPTTIEYFNYLSEMKKKKIKKKD